MATLTERIDEVKAYYGARLLKWEELGYATDKDGNPTDGRYNYKAYFTDKANPDVLKTEIIQINVFNKGMKNEEAFWENRSFAPAKNFHEKVLEKVKAKVADGTFKLAEVVTVDEELKKVVIKAIKDVSGTNEVKHFLISFDEKDNITAVEPTNY